MVQHWEAQHCGGQHLFLLLGRAMRKWPGASRFQQRQKSACCPSFTPMDVKRVANLLDSNLQWRRHFSTIPLFVLISRDAQKEMQVLPEALSIYLHSRHIGQRSWKKKSQTHGADWLLKLVWLLQPSPQFWIRNLVLAAPSQLGLTARNSGGGQIPRFQSSLSVFVQGQTHVDSRQ